jgi:heme o synthase
MISQAYTLTMARIADYYELTKFRLVSLVLLSCAVGFFLASPGPVDVPLMMLTLVGTGLVASGSMSLNQWMERSLDARMVRTATRPLPAGRLHPLEAFIFGIFLSVAGLALLFFAVNLEATVLAAITTLSYVLLYTPLKTKTSLCTIVGAIPGAIPPLIGWSAVTGQPTYGAWLLFAIIFLWQMPHFLAIAWFCRKDYANAGFRMLSVEDTVGDQVGRQIILYSVALLPVSLLPSIVGLTGALYFFGAFFMGVGFIIFTFLSLKKIDQKVRLLFRLSILHLFLLLLLMVIDKV